MQLNSFWSQFLLVVAGIQENMIKTIKTQAVSLYVSHVITFKENHKFCCFLPPVMWLSFVVLVAIILYFTQELETFDISPFTHDHYNENIQGDGFKLWGIKLSFLIIFFTFLLTFDSLVTCDHVYKILCIHLWRYMLGKMSLKKKRWNFPSLSWPTHPPPLRWKKK